MAQAAAEITAEPPLPKTAIPLPMEAIRAFCERWGVVELALFGSVLREDFGPGSDVDAVMTLPEGEGCGLFKLGEMAEELGEVFGRRVDLYTAEGVRIGAKHLVEAAIEIDRTARVIYSGGA